MKYPLYYLNSEEFENLIASICHEILGTGTLSFSLGKDGGRDAKFTGMANNFPSASSPWRGKFIIQAKHTSKPTGSCSDSDFKTILKNELPRIKRLYDNGKLNYYLLFTNRKMTGLQDPKIEDLIDSEVGIEHQVIGNETIQSWLQKYPAVIKTTGLNRLLTPLNFYEQDIQDTIVSFSESKFNRKTIIEIVDKFLRLPLQEKNKRNNLSEQYYTHVMRESYTYFNKIEKFLEDPANSEFKEKYENTVSDLREMITVKHDDFTSFDEILAYLYKIICDRSYAKLLEKRRFIRIFLHFMYATCDIGRKDDREAEEK